MVKKLTADDVDAMAAQAAAFHKQVGLPGEFSTAGFCSQWRKFVDGNVGHVWAQFLDAHLAQAIGIVVHNDVFTGDKIAAVLFWYVDTSRPGKTGANLFLEMMGWCEENEVTRVACSARLSHHFAAMQEFLLGVGFVPKEVAFVTEL